MEWTTSAQGLQLGKGLQILLSSTFENCLQVSSEQFSDWKVFTHKFVGKNGGFAILRKT